MDGATLSWEEIVNRVTIASNYTKVRESAQHYDVALKQASDLRDSLTDLSRRSESWRGGGGNAFRDHVAKLVEALNRTVDDHRRVVTGLNNCAGHLENAVRTIPIPSWKYDEVLAKRQAWHDSTTADVEALRPNSFWTSWLGTVRDAVSDTSTMERVVRSGEELFRNWEHNARQIYDELCRNYARELTELPMPRGTRVKVPGAGTSGAGASGARPPGGPNGQTQPAKPGTQPGTMPPGSGMPTLPTTPPSTSIPGTPGGLGPGTTTPWTPSPGTSWDPSDLSPSTGLESGAGFGGAGIGGGGGGLAGLPIGPAVSVPMSGMDGAAAATGAGRLAAGPAGLGTAGMGMGMMPAGGGAGGAGAADRGGTDTWLKEDENYFGPDPSSPTGIID